MESLESLITALVARLEPLETAVNRAWWEASVSGGRDTYARLEELRNEVDRLLREPRWFEGLAEARRDPSGDPLLARQAELLYLEVLPRRVDRRLSERINRLATAIEHAVATHRPVLRGSERTANDLDRILKKEPDQRLRREAWEARKSVGPRVAGQLSELVELRNEAARSVGFPDYWHLKIALLEQDPGALAGFLERLAALTEGPFRNLKEEIDDRLGERFGIASSEIRPWHYEDPFFQEAPGIYGADLDATYAGADILGAARRFFAEAGLPVDHILNRSSLYEAPGKDPHAFATDIDRKGDVRILLNLRPNQRWMGTTLHELGHAVYDDGIERTLPWTLRRPAHTLMTEAIAMFFGRLSRDAGWMRSVGIVDHATARRLQGPAARELGATMLVFSRWVQVMAGFERALYADPGQDLNRLWWLLVERFQHVAAPRRPANAADYAAKVHVVVAPVYYHNYLMGECFASQLERRLQADVSDGEPAHSAGPEMGAWLMERIFRPGARLHYDDLSRSATGEAVGPDAFASQYLVPAE